MKNKNDKIKTGLTVGAILTAVITVLECVLSNTLQ